MDFLMKFWLIRVYIISVDCCTTVQTKLCMLELAGTNVCPSECGGGEGLPESSPCCDWFSYRHNASWPLEDRTRPANCWPIPVDDDDHAFGGNSPGQSCLEFSRSQVRRKMRALSTHASLVNKFF